MGESSDNSFMLLKLHYSAGRPGAAVMGAERGWMRWGCVTMRQDVCGGSVVKAGCCQGEPQTLPIHKSLKEKQAEQAVLG